MEQLFSGYLPSKGKKPIVFVKDKANWLSEPPKDGQDYVGILNNDILQLDFDTEEDSKIALEIVTKYKLRCCILKTSRGLHFYFKDDRTTKTQSVGIFNTIGLPMDVGLGSKNRVVPLRTTSLIQKKVMRNGNEEVQTIEETVDREWLQMYDELDEIPPYLKPMSHYDFKLKESNTRNQTLFTYILRLQTKGFNKAEIRKTIKIINDFIVYEPLSDSDIDIITRDDAFSQEIFFGEKGGFLHDRFGDYMLSNANILKVEGQLCIYTNDNVYSNDPDEFEKVMLNKISSLKDNQRKEVYKYIHLKCNKKGEYSSPKFIGLKDDILDMEKMELFPYSPSFIIQNKIDYDYKPNAYSEIVDKTLDKVCCNKKDVRMLLEEMVGYSLYRSNSMQQCFILTGVGSNGKSTILNMIKKLLGKQNFTSLDMKDLEDTFRPAEMYNKLANIGDDISSKYLDESSNFKKAVTGESIMVSRKYAHPFELESYATQIFAANQLPTISDKSDGFNRRIVILPFKAKFSSQDSDYDPFIEDKLLSDEGMQYILKLGVEGLKRLLKNGKFTKTAIGEQEKNEFIKDNNPTLQWLDDSPKVINEAVADVYLTYRVWCENNGVSALKQSNFSKELRKEIGVISVPRYINGKTCRVYEYEGE